MNRKGYFLFKYSSSIPTGLSYGSGLVIFVSILHEEFDSPSLHLSRERYMSKGHGTLPDSSFSTSLLASPNMASFQYSTCSDNVQFLTQI